MLRTIIWYLTFVITLLLRTPLLLFANALEKQGRLKERDAFCHRITSKWAKLQVKMSGAKVTVHGAGNIPKDQNVVFISNHQSNFDIALFMACVDKPKGFIAKAEMAKVPLIRSWMRHIGCIFMDRTSLRGSAQAIVEGISKLKAGHSLVIFPEGTRSKGSSMNELKAGSFKLATKPKVPIVPVTISGTYKIMEQNNNRIRPASVDLYIHPPIATDSLTKEELANLPQAVEDIIKSKL